MDRTDGNKPPCKAAPTPEERRASRLWVGLIALLMQAVAAGAAAEQTTPPLIVLWDTAHTGPFPTPSDFSAFRSDLAATSLVDKTDGELTSADLVGIHVYVLVEPDSRDLSAAEVAALRNFLENGGDFLLLTDTDAKTTGVNSLLAGSGIVQAGDFAGGAETTTDVTSHPITAGVGTFWVASGGRTFGLASPAVSCIRYGGATIVAASDLGSHRIAVVGDETSLRNGAYFEADNATLARNIFAWFRSGGSNGRLRLDSSVYPATGTVSISLADNDLFALTTATVEAVSSLGDSETVALAAVGAGEFEGAVALCDKPTSPGDGLLSVADATTVTVIYHDAVGGSGAPADVEASAVIDGRPPAISSVEARRIGPFTATIRWATDEAADSRVRFGESPTALARSVESALLETTHSLEIGWLRPQTTYYFAVGSRDAVGNVAERSGFSLTTCRSRRSSPTIRVLVLYADSLAGGVLDIESKLLADKRIESAEHWDFNATLPDEAALRAYDAVLLHVNIVSPNSEALGDLLADYVESGGPVVGLARSTVEPYAIGGRFREMGYGVIEPGPSFKENERAGLGTVREPDHPVVEGVAAFDGGAWSGHQGEAALTTGSERLADWSDGEVLAAAKTAGGTRLVALNFLGPSSDFAPQLWDSATDGARLIANALVWTSRALECDSWTTPLLLAEPPFTRGTTNTIAWADFPGAEQVRIEWSADGFASVAGRSPWLDQSLHQWTAGGLADGATYRFRLQGRNSSLGYSPFSNVVASTQDASPPRTTIAPLAPTTTSRLIALRISGGDATSGLERADLFARHGTDGPFEQIASFDSLPQTWTFDAATHGGDGRYEFLVLGTDRVGNTESKSQPDAATVVETGSTAARSWSIYDR